MMTCLAVGTLVVLGLMVLAAVVASKSQSKPNSEPETSGSTRTRSRSDLSQVAPDAGRRGLAARAERSQPNTMPPDQSRWVPANEQISVQNYRIPGGLLYVGSGLRAVQNHYEPEPALIDPDLDIDESSPDRSGGSMPYWPSYSTIAPGQRAAYLEWLQGGRSDPSAYIGYVFLFLYGLERRVLADRDGSMVQSDEIGAIASELERLLTLYPNSNSFQRYASQLLGITLIRGGVDLQPHHVRRAAGTGEQLPLVLRCHAGSLATKKLPLPAEWALAWVDADPSMPMRTPAQRCRAEFEALFRIQYAKQHGNGLILKPCKRKVSTRVTPASGSFAGATVTVESEVPDATSLVAPRRALVAIVEGCCDALDSLSRRRGKASDEGNALAELAAMPVDLLATHMPPELSTLQHSLQVALGEREMVSLTAGEVLSDWLPNDDSVLPKARAVDLVRALQFAGFGIEPDVRFGGPTFGRASPITLFRAAPGDPSAPSDAFNAAALLVRLGACITQADGSVGEAELLHLQGHVSSGLHLDVAERRRLGAHLAWLAMVPTDAAKLKKRLGALPQSAREHAGRFVVEVALADGHVDPSEVRSLTKIYRLLGLDESSVHAVIHEAQAGGEVDELVRIPGSGPRSVDVPIPEPTAEHTPKTQKPARRRVLDMAAVEVKVRESAQVAAMLGSLLSSDEDARTQPQPAAVDERCVRTLDGKHTRLLLALGQRATISRESYEGLAHEFGLMPDGAIDVLNELAFDVCDEALLDGDDPIDVNETVFKELVK